MAVSKASDDIWNGKSQFGPRRIGAVDMSLLLLMLTLATGKEI